MDRDKPFPWHGCGGDCKAEDLPDITHPIFGRSSLSYHDLAHAYIDLEARARRLEEALRAIASGADALIDRADAALNPPSLPGTT